jgi:hypothetical protein
MSLDQETRADITIFKPKGRLGAGGFRHGRRNGYQRRAGEFCVDQAAWKRVHTVGVGQSSDSPETATLRMWRCVQDGSAP